MTRPGDDQAKAPTGADADVALLGRMGYAQELRRRMSAFSNFAIAFSTICILAGGITSLQLGVSAVGGAAAGVVWPIGVAFSLVVALSMAQVASAFPTAGGLYHWSAILGGKRLGLGHRLVQPGGTGVRHRRRQRRRLQPVRRLHRADAGDRSGAGWRSAHQIVGVALIAASHALLNHFGIRLTTLLTDFSGYLILAVALLLTLAMLSHAPHPEFGAPVHVRELQRRGGRRRLAAHASLLTMTLLGLMWPIYTITGLRRLGAHLGGDGERGAERPARGCSVRWRSRASSGG